MYAKIEPHRARSVTYAMLRNYKKKTAELKKIAIKCKNLIHIIIIIIIIVIIIIIRIRLHLVKHLMIKVSKRSFIALHGIY